MTTPRATMRLQFHRGFTFADATAAVGYFAALGVSHLYASPIMTARPGSTHGYDTVDPTQVNPELGGEAGLRHLVEALRANDMGLIVDIVPNHMAVGSGNTWWMDVLAHGPSSRYAKYFDIDWQTDERGLKNKVLLPVLGRPYGEALAAKEISLVREDGRVFARYFDHRFPLAPESAALLEDRSLAEFDPASASGRKRLHRLLQLQHYRLAWWRAANDEINWRRFFDINDLAALRVEDDDVFEAVHATVFRLYAEGLVDGLRIDHIDGLSGPEAYCLELRARLQDLERQRPAGCPRGPAYLVVEKILAYDEELPQSWRTDGTTGYDFMNEVSALQHDPSGERALTELWRRVSGQSPDFAVEEERARREVLQRSFAAQLESTVRVFSEIAAADIGTRDIPRAALRRCLSEILMHFPVYRIYAGVGRASDADRTFLARAVAGAERTCLPSDRWLLPIIAEWLAGNRITASSETQQDVALRRFQQLSAPLSAKAVEDTAFYRYGRLLSRNDVGFDPARFAASPAEFHGRMERRMNDHPHSMLATATHDHKRGEDVRARLAVLSEIADEWAETVARWIASSDTLCARRRGELMPTAADRLMLFQTIVGAWPMELVLSEPDNIKAFAVRLGAWQQKALREAKTFSDWSAPDEAYEQAAQDFIQRLFGGSSDLLMQIATFVQRVAPAGAANGLAQALLKLTAPGVPDIYQGTEYWDFSLVDPDNRNAVDFPAREASLAIAVSDMCPWSWTDGRAKQFVIARCLALRKKEPALFADATFLPLEAQGPAAAHIVAYARVSEASTAVATLCRLPAKLLTNNDFPRIAAERWSGTHIIIPAALRGMTVANVLSPGQVLTLDEKIGAERVLSRWPVGLFISSQS